MQINARLDEEYADKLAYIQQQTNQSITDVIKSALELYYQQLQQEQKNALSMLKLWSGRSGSVCKLQVNFERWLETLSMIIVDTGFWLALANRNDLYLLL
ncbi:MAG: CopG family transcriptional regulator [Nostoc sp.]|uniref:CopG family transcriptional regulator n=1 Tax=Nostoc sp. TaxID=1180 RepID=UPI002FF86B73